MGHALNNSAACQMAETMALKKAALGLGLNNSAACQMAETMALKKAALGLGAKVVHARRKTFNSHDLVFVVQGTDGTRKEVGVTDAALKRRITSAARS